MVLNTPRVMRKFDKNTLEQIGSDLTVFQSSVTPASIVLAGAASAVIGSTSARVAVVELATNFTNDITVNTFSVNNTASQQMAYNSVNGSIMMTAAINNEATLLTNTATAVIFSPSIGAFRAACVITKLASGGGHANTWLMGTSSGKVIEVGLTGTITSTLTLPASTTTGTGTPVVTGLSHSPPNLVVHTAQGIGYFYNYDTSTLIHMFPCGVGTDSNPTGVALCESASGFTLAAPYGNGQQGGTFDLMRFDTTNLTYTNFPSFSGGVTQRYYETQLNTGVSPPQAVTTGLGTSSEVNLIKFSLSALSGTTEDTELHTPQGVRAASRIIRIRDDGVGQTCIELDTNISAATTSLACRKNSNYIELAISQDTLTWDVREFSK